MTFFRIAATPVLLLFLFLPATRLYAEAFRLADVFGDHMILQWGKPVPVWGWADAGTPVEVSFAGQVRRTRAGDIVQHTRVHPMAPYAINSVIRQQGKAGPGGKYGVRMAAKFERCREVFGQDFSVLVGTLTRSTHEQTPLEPTHRFFYRSLNNPGIRRVPGYSGPDSHKPQPLNSQSI